MTPAVSLTSQSLEPVQAFAATNQFDSATVTLDSSSGTTYTGSAIKPTVSSVLVKYTVSGSDNPDDDGQKEESVTSGWTNVTYAPKASGGDSSCINAGTYVATVTGALTNGVQYTGSTEYEITAAEVSASATGSA